MDQHHKSTKIAAYFYGEQLVCPKCVREMVVPFYRIADSGRSTEAILSEAASGAGINRSDETSFNSHDFPKVIYASEIIKNVDRCYICGRLL